MTTLLACVVSVFVCVCVCLCLVYQCVSVCGTGKREGGGGGVCVVCCGVVWCVHRCVVNKTHTCVSTETMTSHHKPHIHSTTQHTHPCFHSHNSALHTTTMNTHTHHTAHPWTHTHEHRSYRIGCEQNHIRRAPGRPQVSPIVRKKYRTLLGDFDRDGKVWNLVFGC